MNPLALRRRKLSRAYSSVELRKDRFTQRKVRCSCSQAVEQSRAEVVKISIWGLLCEFLARVFHSEEPDIL